MNTNADMPTARGPGLFQGLKSSRVLKIYISMLLLYSISVAIAPTFLSFDNVNQTIALASFLGVVAIGQTIVIISGGLDLSISYAMNFGAVVLTQESLRLGGVAGLALALLAGLAIGLFNGFFIAYLGIAPMIMTLATNSILKSLTYVYTGGTPRGSAASWIIFIGSGSILGVKVALLFWALLSVGVIVLLSKTVFGRKVYALGNNRATAYLSGIDNRHVTLGVYALSSVFAALAGVLLTGLSEGRAYLGMGDFFQLASIAAVVIGATSILGGKGGYLGTIAGCIMIYVLNSMLAVLSIRDAGRQIIYGLVVFIVLLLYGRGEKIRG
jgi:ribose transport system permease protein